MISNSKLPLYIFLTFFFVALISISYTFTNEEFPPLKLLSYSFYAGIIANIPLFLIKLLRLMYETPAEPKRTESSPIGNEPSGSGYNGGSGGDCSGGSGDGGGC